LRKIKINCKQSKCCFLGTPLCPVCRECKSRPNVVSENCVTCWNCEHDLGELRGNINLGRVESMPNKEQKVLEEEMMGVKI